MPRAFQYQSRPAEAWAKREQGKSFEGFIRDEFQTYTPKKENWIRYLPPTWDNPTHYGLDVFVHYGVGPSNASVLCLKRMRGENCPVCEAHDRATEAGRPDADQLRATRRVLVWIVDRKAELDGGVNYKKQPIAWAQPATKVDQEVAKQCRDRFTGELYQIDNPDSGNDVMFEKTGDSMTNTVYGGFQVAKKPTSVDDAYLEFILAHPLPSILNWRSYEEVQSLFEGQFAGETTEAPPVNAPVTITTPPATVVVPPVVTQPFVPEWLNSTCPSCGQRQFTAPNGVTCQSGHLFSPPPPPPPQPVVTSPPPGVVVLSTAIPVVTPPVTTATPPPPQPMTYVQNPPPQPVATAPPPMPTASAPAQPGQDRAANLRARFHTGR